MAKEMKLIAVCKSCKGKSNAFNATPAFMFKLIAGNVKYNCDKCGKVNRMGLYDFEEDDG